MLRSFFIGLSTNKAFRAFSERSSVGRRVSRRFVAGMSIDEAIDAAAALNAEGIDVSLDSLGESVLDVAHAEASAAVYHQLLDAIHARSLRANVSVKLTQVGMDIGGTATGPALAERIVGEMVAHAARSGSFVRIDMEGSEYTEPTLALTERLHQQYPGAVGTVLQAYLFRTEQDAERLLSQGIRIRLCKGAYKEPAEIAFPVKADVDANYVKLMKRVVSSPVFAASPRTTKLSSRNCAASSRQMASTSGRLSSRCSTESAATCSVNSLLKVLGCAFTSPLAPSGIPTSCAGWPNVLPTYSSSRRTSSRVSASYSGGSIGAIMIRFVSTIRCW